MEQPKKWEKLPRLARKPLVAICTPTCNRRKYFPRLIECIKNQTYTQEKIIWIIYEDGDETVEDLVKDIPNVYYFSLKNQKKTMDNFLEFDVPFKEKVYIGEKRNFLNFAAKKFKAELILYQDDDDFMHPERISNSIMMLQQTPKAWAGGCSAMHIYFNEFKNIIQVGPYGKNHATAGTWCFRIQLLNFSKFNENAEKAEEREFLHDYTVPFCQFDEKKNILVMSHDTNTVDKHFLLHESSMKQQSSYKIEDFIKDPILLEKYL